jgi:Protein of unknown function (DUF1186)/SEC-C motif
MQPAPSQWTAERVVARLTGDVDAVGLPYETLRAATALRTELVPRFLAEIEQFTTNPTAWVNDGSLLFFAVHLLGEWREPAAYMPLLRLLRVPGNRVEAVFGDSTIETLPRVVAAVYDGDPLPIFEAIHDTGTNEYLRWELFSTLAILVRDDRLERARVVDFLRTCFATLQPQETDLVWYGWQDAVAKLGVTELEPLARLAFDRELICLSMCDFDDFKEEFDHVVKSGTAADWYSDERYTPFGAVIDEMADWHCFTEEGRQEAREEARATKPNDERATKPDLTDRELKEVLHELMADVALGESDFTFASQPTINEQRFIGRNDPCPCRSGKKYKKCCLN